MLECILKCNPSRIYHVTYGGSFRARGKELKLFIKHVISQISNVTIITMQIVTRYRYGVYHRIII